MLLDCRGYLVWPFYLLCDQSGSMSGTPIEAVNDGLQKIWRELIKSPTFADKAWVSVISFHVSRHLKNGGWIMQL
jgi:uncharacterized protein YegL